MTTASRLRAGVAAGLGGLSLVVYIVIIVNEGNNSLGQVAPWALVMAAASAAAAIGAATSRTRPLLVAGVLFILIGLPAIFSVGLPLIVAGVLCLTAYSPPGA